MHGHVLGRVVEHERGDGERHPELVQQPRGDQRQQAARRHSCNNSQDEAEPERSRRVDGDYGRSKPAHDHLAFTAYAHVIGAPGYGGTEPADDYGRGPRQRCQEVIFISKCASEHCGVNGERILPSNDDGQRAYCQSKSEGHQGLHRRGQQMPDFLVNHDLPLRPSASPVLLPLRSRA